ncbi:hypothetical protein ACU686_13115 [Yinghuangia aomiensis]
MRLVDADADGAPGAALWLLVGPRLGQVRVTTALAEAFTREFGPRCAVVHTPQVLLGVRGGQLTLHDLDGRELAPPRVVYARLATPTLSTDGDVTLLRHLQALGAVLVNPVDAVLACVNKFWQLQELASGACRCPTPGPTPRPGCGRRPRRACPSRAWSRRCADTAAGGCSWPATRPYSTTCRAVWPTLSLFCSRTTWHTPTAATFV